MQSKHKRKILIVDDVKINRLILADLFEDEYDILQACDGREAIRLIDKNTEEIAVVLLDIIMPVMDGVQVLEQMKNRNLTAHIPVVLITGESDDKKALMCYSYGVADLIHKPFNPEIVLRRVKNIIKLYSHNRYLKESLENQKKLLEAQSRKLAESTQFVIDALCTTVEFRNFESGEHVRRIRLITKILLEAVSEFYLLTREEIEIISSAAAVHDIGKIAIPDSILLKPGALTPEEFEIMKTHTVIGCEILESLGMKEQEYFKYCYEICRHHHERYDGSGYPDGLKGDEISIWAQAASVADVYDALTSKRMYKDAYTHSQAIEMIKNGECGAFNPKILGCLMKSERELEKLTSGRKEIIGTIRDPLSDDNSLPAPVLI